jgi:hypothetical protein
MLNSPVEEVLFYDVSIGNCSRRGERLEGGALPARFAFSNSFSTRLGA